MGEPRPTNAEPTRFVEAECEIGGCRCPIWSEWFWTLIGVATESPKGRALDLTDEEAAAEAINRIAEDMAPTFDWPAPPCSRVTCHRHRHRTA